MTIGSQYTFSSNEAYQAYRAYLKSKPGTDWIKQMRQIGVKEIAAMIAMAGAFENGFNCHKQITEIKRNAQN